MGPESSVSPPPADSGSGGVWDTVGSQVGAAVSGWLGEVVTGALGPVTGAAALVVGVPDQAVIERLHQLWSVSAGIANSLAVLFVLAGGVLVMSHGSVQTRYTIKEVAPRVVVGFLAANLSWVLLSTGFELSRALTLAVAVDGINPAQALTQAVVNTVTGGPVFMMLLGLVLTILMVVFVITMLVVLALLVVLIVAAPLALICHMLPGLDPIARAWWKAVLAALAVPAIQTLILAATTRVALFSPAGAGTGLPGPSSLLTMLAVIALVYLMIKVPSWLLRPATTGPGRGRRSFLGSLLKTVIAVKALGALGLTTTAGGGVGTARGGVGGLLGAVTGGAGRRGRWLGRALATSSTRGTRRGAPAAGPAHGAGAPMPGLATLARSRAARRPRRVAALGPVTFLAPPPASPSRYRPVHATAAPSPAVFTEASTAGSTTAVPGPTPVMPRFRAVASSTSASVGTPTRAAAGVLFSHPESSAATPTTAGSPKVPAAPGAAARPVGRGAVAVFLTPTPGPHRPAPGSGGRGYHVPAHPVVFSSPTPDPVGRGTYRPAPLHPVFPHPPAPTPPPPSTGASLPRRRGAAFGTSAGPAARTARPTTTATTAASKTTATRAGKAAGKGSGKGRR
ncbi:MAG: hypothetical protein IVW52_09325 [Acidimicrobiales bacterium]|nr:hypothetical protein [Acidimicrobiales bacterium]